MKEEEKRHDTYNVHYYVDCGHYHPDRIDIEV